jgi:2-oxoglutarate ferredoxin oxidoreductase subunit alpha
MTGLTHNQDGFPTNDPARIKEKLDKLKNKIVRFYDEIEDVEADQMDDARICVFSYGTVARAARQAVQMARAKRIKVGAIRPISIWPFPDEKIKALLKGVKHVIVAELNQGQLINEIERIAPKTCDVHGLNRYDGEMMAPQSILAKIQEVK